MRIKKEIKERLKHLRKPWSELSKEFPETWFNGYIECVRALEWVLEPSEDKS